VPVASSVACIAGHGIVLYVVATRGNRFNGFRR
jgi:hypothetical protein